MKVDWIAIGSVATGALALATLWLARSTRETLAYGEGTARVRLLADILDLFEDKVLHRSTVYEDATKKSNTKLLGPYQGPTGPNAYGGNLFHHPTFRLHDAIGSRASDRLETSGDVAISATDVVNGIEQFAALVEASLKQKVWSSDVLLLLGSPTAETFIQTVNEYYDVICFYRASQSANLYSATKALYERWEPLVVAEAIRSREHLGEAHGMGPVLHSYRVGFNQDFDDYLPTRSHAHHKTESKGGCEVALARHELEWKDGTALVWIQAVGTSGAGLPGFPVAVTLSRARVGRVLAGRKDNGESESTFFLGNSSGSVILELFAEDLVVPIPAPAWIEVSVPKSCSK